MNKKGFTLVELLAVLVLIILIMLLVVPNLRNLMTSNDLKQYESYEDMMVEYTKTYPNYKEKEYICLEDLGISKINPKIKCNGFVKIADSKINPYLYCLNQNLDELYKTKDYDEDTPACYGIIDTSLSMIATINDTNNIYISGTWINGKDYVNLSYKTLSNMESVYAKDVDNNILSCNLKEENNIYGCSIPISKTGIYDSYGVLDGENVYSQKITINIDSSSPTFDIYDENNTLISTSSEVTIEKDLDDENINIINNILNLKDNESGIKEIKYSFEKDNSENYINLSGSNLKITKTLEPGTYKLIVIATDNVGNETKKEVTYILHEKSIEICANFHINGALKINEREDDLRLCCYSTDKISCDITTPTITPIDGFSVLGWSDDGDVLTSANYEVNQTVTLISNEDDVVESEGEEVNTTEKNFYAITRKPNPSVYQVTFNPNGATSFEIDGTSYTEATTFKCGSGYVYNGDETLNSCTFILPTILRTGGTVYGWDENEENEGSPTYQVLQEFSVNDDIELFAITSKDITLTYSGNISATNQVGSDNLSSRSETKTIFNDEGTIFNIPSYSEANLCRTQGGNEKYHGYKLLGLNRSKTGTTIEYCFSDQIYLEENKTLYAVWQDVYARAVGNVGNNLRLRSGAGTSYSQVASIKKGDPVYIKSSKYTWNSSDRHTWYPVIYGSKTGYAAGNTSKNSDLVNLTLKEAPKASSCSYTYSCTSNNKLLSITPSDVYLNITENTAKQKMSQTLTIDNQCGGIESATVGDTSLISATKAGVITAKAGSVAENQTKTTTVTYKTKYGCSEKVNVTVKNTEATAPEISISISGDSSSCSGSYLKGAKATVKCVSDLPITSYSAKIGSTSYSSTTSGNTKTSTISLSSTGSKTIKVTCANSEGSTTKSKSVSIKVRNASSTCGCSTYYTASSAGSTCSRCASWSFAWNGNYSGASKPSNYCHYVAANGKQYKVTYINVTTSDTGRYYADTKTYRCSSFKCKTYKTCCHT